ncbi:hypothetical protein B566_EDAN019427, partial [Ephemera danica]
YAQFPGGSSATDGVVIGPQYFGNTGWVAAPYDKGRTATHEVGHWLNLRHIWGDASCGNDQHEKQPTVFESIPAALWWGVNNMTTVGYGDMMPITPLGKIISGIVSILGVAAFGLPTGILASGFADHLETPKVTWKILRMKILLDGKPLQIMPIPKEYFWVDIPCLVREEYPTNMMLLMPKQTGFDIWENDGPYPGDFCGSTLHPGHKNYADSQWRQMEIQKDLYHWLNEKGVYINAPD